MLASAFIYLSLSFFLKDKVLIDCLLVALSLPSLLLVIWTGSISYQLTPLLVSQYSKGELNYHFCRVLLARLFVVIIFLFVIMWLFRGSIIQLMVPGFSQEKLNLAKELIQLSILLTPLQLANSTLSSFFITLRRNIFAGVISLLGYLITITILILNKNAITPHLVIFGILTGNAITFLIFICEYFRKYYLSSQAEKTYDFNFLHFFKEIFIVICILAVSRSLNVIQNGFASHMKDGSITLLTYTSYITNVIITILITPILNIYYTRHCEWWSARQHDQLFLAFRKGIFVIFIMVLVSASFLFLSYDFLVEVIAMIGKQIDFAIDVNIFKLLFLSTSCLITSAFISRMFYVAGFLKFVNIIELFCVVAYVLFSYFLSKAYGIVGLYLSFFMYALLVMTLVFVFLKKKINFQFPFSFFVQYKKIVFTVAGLLISSIVMNLLIGNALLKAIFGIAFFVGGAITLYFFKRKTDVGLI